MSNLSSRPQASADADRQAAEALGRVLLSTRTDLSVPAAEEEETTIDLAAIFWRLVANLRWIILAAVVGLIIGGLVGYRLIVPRYTATAKLYMLSSDNSVVDLSALQISSNLTNDYVEVFKTWELHEMVRDQLGLDYSYNELTKMLNISNPSGTRVIYVSVTNEDPALAARIANAYVSAAQTFVETHMDSKTPSQFSEALVPTAPVTRSARFFMAIGLLLGMVIACAVIVVIELLDDRPKTPDDILKYTGLTTLAVVPVTDPKRKTGHGAYTKRSREDGSKGGHAHE